MPVDEGRFRRLQDQRDERCARRPDGAGASALIRALSLWIAELGRQMAQADVGEPFDSLRLRPSATVGRSGRGDLIETSIPPSHPTP